MPILTSSTLNLYCWTGRFNQKPTQPQYTITKRNPDSNNVIRFEIGELVEDYIDIVFNNDYSEGNIKSTCWWSYTKTNEYSDIEASVPGTGYGIATKGYTYFEDGINSTLTTSKLFSNNKLYIPENTEYAIPVYIGPGGVSNVIFYTKDSSGNETEAGSESTGGPITQAPSSQDSNKYIKYIASSIQASKIEIISQNTSSPTYNNLTQNATETIYPIFTCEPKYIQYKVSFINKFGAIQDLYFNKKRTDELNVKRDSFVTSTITSSSTGVSFNQYNPSNIVQDVSTKKSLTLNTGFLNEEFNEVMRQLFQSEDVWIRDENKTLPVNIKDSDFTYKTHLNDKLVNYTVKFEFAFDGINNIR